MGRIRAGRGGDGGGYRRVGKSASPVNVGVDTTPTTWGRFDDTEMHGHSARYYSFDDGIQMIGEPTT